MQRNKLQARADHRLQATPYPISSYTTVLCKWSHFCPDPPQAGGRHFRKVSTSMKNRAPLQRRADSTNKL